MPRRERRKWSCEIPAFPKKCYARHAPASTPVGKMGSGQGRWRRYENPSLSGLVGLMTLTLLFSAGPDLRRMVFRVGRKRIHGERLHRPLHGFERNLASRNPSAQPHPVNLRAMTCRGNKERNRRALAEAKSRGPARQVALLAACMQGINLSNAPGSGRRAVESHAWAYASNRHSHWTGGKKWICNIP